MDQTAKETRIVEWSRLLSEAEASGMSNAEWCRTNGITEKRFYYWKRKTRQAKKSGSIPEQKTETGRPSQAPAFLELLPPAEACREEKNGTACLYTGKKHQEITLHFGGYTLSVNDPDAEETLRMVLKVLRDA